MPASNSALLQPIKTSIPDIRAERVARILIVDDDDEIRLLLKWALSREGYMIFEAENGRAAIESLSESRPDLILSDIQMPEMDGFEMCAALQKSPRHSHIPVVLISSQGEKTERECLALSGARGYIRKSGAMRDVLRCIRKCL